eukprot:scaffold2571_cov101-Isochrysis_galbana.AAC.2
MPSPTPAAWRFGIEKRCATDPSARWRKHTRGSPSLLDQTGQGCDAPVGGAPDHRGQPRRAGRE